MAHWFFLIAGYWVVQPRLGTVQSLVSTGDLALIRDDSLRIAIPNFLTNMVAFEGFEDDGVERWDRAVRQLDEYIDFDQLRIETLSPTARDSILSSDPLTPLPSGPMRVMPHQDLGVLIRNADVHRMLADMLRAKRTTRLYRDLMSVNTEMLLERVRSAQAP